MPIRRFRRRRTIRRRRTFRYRRPRVPRLTSLNRFDGLVKMKCICGLDLLIAGNSVTFTVSWRRTATTANMITLADSPEYVKFQALFNEYTVKYLSLKIQRINEVQSAADDNQNIPRITNQALQPVNVASSTTTPLTFAQMIRCPDFKAYTGYAQISRNYKVGKYFKKRDIQWMNTADSIAAGSSNMCTQVMSPTLGLENGRVWGQLIATWYVYFRGMVK